MKDRIHRRKPRILIVIAHFDENRTYRGRPNFMPQGVGHAFLAGAFHPERTEIKLYSEFHSGPLEDEALLSWPDMLVLTSVTSAFDRMKHLTAYTRTLAPNAIVVAGGPAVRNLPLLSRDIFDYACDDDIEELQSIAADVFGRGYVADEMEPRFDLLTWRSPVNYVESSRYCNFKCSFCALSGEKRPYRAYDSAYIERQIRKQPPGRHLLFIDNNFYGNNRRAYESKLDLIGKLWREGLFKGWIALVTNDFFARPKNVTKAKEAGCVGLFSGVESFDEDELARYSKKQNLAVPQIDAIEQCLRAGIVFQYGLIFDPAAQRVDLMRKQLDFVIDDSRMPLPAFNSLTIPLLGTPFFDDCAEQGQFLPDAKLRDMDGFTLVLKSKDPDADVIPFTRALNGSPSFAARVVKRQLGFYRRYRRDLSREQMAILLSAGGRICFPSMSASNTRFLPRIGKAERRTYVTTTQPVGRLYEPLIRLSGAFETHFQPTMVTDANGNLCEEIEANLAARPSQPRAIQSASTTLQALTSA